MLAPVIWVAVVLGVVIGRLVLSLRKTGTDVARAQAKARQAYLVTVEYAAAQAAIMTARSTGLKLRARPAPACLCDDSRTLEYDKDHDDANPEQPPVE